MSQCHTYLPKARYINASRGVTFFFENVTQRHTFPKKSCIIKRLVIKRMSHYLFLVIEC